MKKKYTKEELENHRKEWVEALRSDEYQQDQGALKTDRGYCCLGVACLVAGLKPEVKEDNGVVKYYFDNQEDFLPEFVQEYFGLRDVDGAFGDEFISYVNSLSILNDQRDWTFEQIAKLIEEKPKGLFDD